MAKKSYRSRTERVYRSIEKHRRTASSISSLLNMDKSTVIDALNQMEKKGWIQGTGHYVGEVLWSPVPGVTPTFQKGRPYQRKDPDPEPQEEPEEVSSQGESSESQSTSRDWFSDLVPSVTAQEKEEPAQEPQPEPEVAGNLPVYMIDGEPMVYDLDLARELGYSKPANIRELIGRLYGSGQIGEEGLFRTAQKSTGGRPGTAYYLGEKAALKVVTKSETPKADAITDQVIDVFVQARKGQLPQPGPSQSSEPLSDPLRTASLYLEAGKLFGTDGPTAKAVAAEQVRRIHDIDFRPLIQDRIPEEDRYLTPTELGKPLGLTPQEVNAFLERKGFQFKDGKGGWIPTETGRNYCSWHPYQSPNSNRTGYQLLWHPSILKELRF